MAVEYSHLLRNSENYKSDVLINNVSETGINFEYPLHAIIKFCIWENISGDTMHDVGEGNADYTLEEVLTYYVEESRVCSLPYLNNLIEKFPYNDVEKGNKPRPLFFEQTKKGRRRIKLKQSSAESLYLARYLILMIADLISSNYCKHWNLYVYLRRIIGIITCPQLSKGP